MKTTTKTVSFDLAKVLLTEDQLSDLISTAMADTCGFEWWKEGDPSDYDKAEEELAKELGVESDDLYFEQIWARMLFNGGSLLLLESASNPASGRVMTKCGFQDTGREVICPNLEIGSDQPVRVLKLDFPSK